MTSVFGMTRARLAGVLVATTLLVGLSGALTLAGSAGAAPYALDGLGASCVEPGGSNTVHGNGFSSGASVNVLLGSTQVTVLTADGSGVVDGSFTVPSDFATGATTVKLVGPSAHGQRTLSFDMTVGCAGPNAGGANAAAGSGSGSGTLAFTGGNVGMTVGIAAALLIIGVAFLGARRKKSSAS